jgi:hypothetical protein
MARELLGYQPLLGKPAPREAFKLANLTRFETVGVSEDPDRNRLGNGEQAVTKLEEGVSALQGAGGSRRYPLGDFRS